MRAIETAAAAVELAAGQAELASAHIELAAIADVEIRLAAEAVALDAGETWSVATAAPIDIEVPGVLTARVVPGAQASDTQARLDAAQRVLAAALAAAKVDDVEAARTADQRRRELVTTRDRANTTAEALTGDDTVEAMRARLAALKDGEPAGTGPLDVEANVEAVRAELDAAVAAHQQALVDCETHRKVAAAASKRLGEKSTRACVQREKVTAAEAELTAARERLASQRASVSDDDLAVKAEAVGEEARRATGRVAELGGELAATKPDTVAAALDDAVRRAESLGNRYDEAAESLREVSAQLKVYGTEGRKGQLDAAETEHEHAESEYVRVHRRARATQLLRSVMARHRDATRQRYVDPFRSSVERLGRIVFGDSFEVEIDSELRICSRTLCRSHRPVRLVVGRREGAAGHRGAARRCGAGRQGGQRSRRHRRCARLHRRRTADQNGSGVRRGGRRRPGHRVDLQPSSLCRCRGCPPRRTDRVALSRRVQAPRRNRRPGIRRKRRSRGSRRCRH